MTDINTKIDTKNDTKIDTKIDEIVNLIHSNPALREFVTEIGIDEVLNLFEQSRQDIPNEPNKNLSTGIHPDKIPFASFLFTIRYLRKL